MKFGIFYEHQMGRPWADDHEQRLIQDALEQVELADSLGIQYVWEVEHHFLEEYSHSSAPEVFLAAGSQRTSRIRLGHGIVLTAPQFNHPARVAERISMLDLVSNGRVEFGSGESSSEAELAGFQIDPIRKRDAWLEGLETAVRCMTETPFTGVDGEFVTDAAAQRRAQARAEAPSAAVGGVQPARHDPARRREGHRRADVRLHRPRGGTFVGELLRGDAGRAVRPGRATRQSAGRVRVTDDAPPRRGHGDRRGVEGANFFGYSLGHYYIFGTHRPAVTNVWAEYEQRRSAQGFDPEAVAAAVKAERLGAKVAAGDTTGLRGCIGTPEQLREYLRRFEEAGVDQVIFVMQAGRNEHDHIMESIEIFGREVLPEFVERDEKAIGGEGRAPRAGRRGGTGSPGRR